MANNKYRVNGESQKQLLEIIINDIRESRSDIKKINNLLTLGSNKIAANRQAITDIQENQRWERLKAWGGSGAITVLINIVKYLTIK